jgi:tRNA U34 2-thiouridine synthase MnmA/TrmU
MKNFCGSQFIFLPQSIALDPQSRPESSENIELQGRCEAGRFQSPVYGVAPGQAAVLYDGERGLGGGWIEATVPAKLEPA